MVRMVRMVRSLAERTFQLCVEHARGGERRGEARADVAEHAEEGRAAELVLPVDRRDLGHGLLPLGEPRRVVAADDRAREELAPAVQRPPLPKERVVPDLERVGYQCETKLPEW